MNKRPQTYGTFLFDSFFYEEKNLIDGVLKVINQDFSEQLQFFKQIEKIREDYDAIIIDNIMNSFTSQEIRIKNMREKDCFSLLKKCENSWNLKKKIKKIHWKTSKNLLRNFVEKKVFEEKKSEEISINGDEKELEFKGELMMEKLDSQNLKIEEEELDLI